MGFFTQRKPRPFRHEYIYYDERKEKLKKIEENAKRELGMLPERKEVDRERIHEAFINSTKHLKRRKEKGGKVMSYKLLFVLIAAALFLLHYLLTNRWNF